MLLANIAKLRSEDPFRQVGACALDYNNKVLGVSYNGLMAGHRLTDEILYNREKRRKYFLHAEVNLLNQFKTGSCNIIATTCLPCSSCAQLIISHGIKNVVYEEGYSTENDLSKEIFEEYNINLIELKK